jgi:MmyB-like transcription regulator ligand binding domain
VRPQLKLLLETLRPNPAYVTSRTLDLLATNPGALALYAGIEDWPAPHRNIGRFLFLHPAARDICADWDDQIRGCVARLRALAGTDPDAPDLAALVGELLLKSPDFAKLWERYDVTRRTAAQKKTFHHPHVGTITLGFQGMQLEGHPRPAPGRLRRRTWHPRLRRHDPARPDRPPSRRKAIRTTAVLTPTLALPRTSRPGGPGGGEIQSARARAAGLVPVRSVPEQARTGPPGRSLAGELARRCRSRSFASTRYRLLHRLLHRLTSRSPRALWQCSNKPRFVYTPSQLPPEQVDLSSRATHVSVAIVTLGSRKSR